MANYQFKPSNRADTYKMHPQAIDTVVNPMRDLGQTGLKVGRVGLGTLALGRLGLFRLPDDEAQFIVATAVDQEANLIDCSPEYGDGRAERMVGKAIKGRRLHVVLVSKAGRHSDGRFDYDEKPMRASLDASLRRLDCGVLDVLMIDRPSDAMLAESPVWALGQTLKKEGKIRALGVALARGSQTLAATKNAAIEVIEAPFNIWEQEAEAAFSAIQEKRLGFIAARPMARGFTTGRYGRLAFFMDERSVLSRKQIWRRARLARMSEGLMATGLNEGQSALAFTLAHDAVTCAIPGSSSWHHVVQNVAVGQFPLDARAVAEAKALYERELKREPLEA